MAEFGKILRSLTPERLMGGEAYLKYFGFPSITKEGISNFVVARYDMEEWMAQLPEGKEVFVFGTSLKRPENYIKDLKMKDGVMKLFGSNGAWCNIPQEYVTKISIDNEDMYVVLIPGVYDIRYESSIHRVVALVAKVPNKQMVLVNVETGRITGEDQFEIMNYSKFFDGEFDINRKKHPGYVGVKKKMPNLEDMSITEMQEEWISVFGTNFRETPDEEFCDDPRYLAMIQKLCDVIVEDNEKREKSARKLPKPGIKRDGAPEIRDGDFGPLTLKQLIESNPLVKEILDLDGKKIQVQEWNKRIKFEGPKLELAIKDFKNTKPQFSIMDAFRD